VFSRLAAFLFRHTFSSRRLLDIAASFKRKRQLNVDTGAIDFEREHKQASRAAWDAPGSAIKQKVCQYHLKHYRFRRLELK